MKGIVRGFETVDYINKRQEPVKGVTFFITHKSQNVIGERVTEQYISKDSPFYPPIANYLSSDVTALIGAQIFIDFSTVKRGNYTFTDICDLEITPVTKEK